MIFFQRKFFTYVFSLEKLFFFIAASYVVFPEAPGALLANTLNDILPE